MSLSLAQLTAPKSFSEWFATVIAALQGLGIVVPANGGGTGAAVGTGSVSLSGSPTLPASVASPTAAVVKVSTGGEPGGAAQVQVSLDAGATYAGAVAVPSNGQVAVTGTQGATGVTATLTAGPAGSGASFVAGDIYSFQLSTPSFPVTAWQAGSVPRTLAAFEAYVLQDFSALVQAIAAGGIAAINPATGLPWASGPWADLLGQNVYGLTRNPAVATIGLATLSDAQGQGPFTLAPGQLVASSTGGQQYQSTTGGTLPKNGTLQLSWQAIVPGAAGNVANGTITTLNTTLPGVTINNPDPGGGTWITTAGADPESDLNYLTRCTARWSSLGIGATAATYDAWARTADASIARTLVQADAVTPGQVDVWCAGTGAPAGGGAVAAAQAYINARLPLGLVALVRATTAVPITVSGTVYFYLGRTTSPAATAAVAAALNAFFAEASIGEDNTPTTFIYLNQLIGVIENAFGVRNVVLSSPGGDTGLILGEQATLTNSLAFVGV